MLALVVYESMFGNTRRIAEAIAEGVGTVLPVKAIAVGAAPETVEEDIDLLIVGGPTHVHGMSTERTRAGATQQGAPESASAGQGIREWLEHLRPRSGDPVAAAFDTRINGPMLVTGSAAKGYTKGLTAAGFRVTAPPRSFLVRGRAAQASDALVPGELQAARDWGRQVAATVKPA